MPIQTKNDAVSSFEEATLLKLMLSSAFFNEKTLHVVVLLIIGFPKSYQYQQVVLPALQ